MNWPLNLLKPLLKLFCDLRVVRSSFDCDLEELLTRSLLELAVHVQK